MNCLCLYPTIYKLSSKSREFLTMFLPCRVRMILSNVVLHTSSDTIACLSFLDYFQLASVTDTNACVYEVY